MVCRQLIKDVDARPDAFVAVSDNLGKFYRFVNKSSFSINSGVGALFDPDSHRTVLTDLRKANRLLNNTASLL